jgi:hypothetical protein
MNTFNIPVLFLIFNRLDTAKQVFEAIRTTAPSRLYIASDGHRENKANEREKVESVRKYVLESIDWDCEVKTLFRENNLGCGKAVSEAITWFFKNEEMGIILEDDCLPSMSFFPYCKELLEKYKDNEQIYYITGFNPLTNTQLPYSYYFARIIHFWGWASWRRAWNHYSFNIADLDNFITQKKIHRIFNRKADRKYWLDIFKIMERHGIDTWDYQWMYNIQNNNGICIIPVKNLITNIGFGADATHTIADDPHLNNQDRFEINQIKHPEKAVINTRLNNKLNIIAFRTTTLSYYNKIINEFLKKHRLHNALNAYIHLVNKLKKLKT